MSKCDHPLWEVDYSTMLTSLPPQYRGRCISCGATNTRTDTAWSLVKTVRKGDVVYTDNNWGFNTIKPLGNASFHFTGEVKVNSWYDYDKQEAISLPPVGTVVECLTTPERLNVWREAKLLHVEENKRPHTHNCLLVTENGAAIWASKLRPLDWDKNNTFTNNNGENGGPIPTPTNTSYDDVLDPRPSNEELQVQINKLHYAMEMMVNALSPELGKIARGNINRALREVMK